LNSDQFLNWNGCGQAKFLGAQRAWTTLRRLQASGDRLRSKNRGGWTGRNRILLL